MLKYKKNLSEFISFGSNDCIEQENIPNLLRIFNVRALGMYFF